MTNYDAGRRFEWAVRDHLIAEGYDVVRSAGSKTKADLVAIKEGEVLIVQCKRDGKCSPTERAEILRIASLLPGVGVPLIACRPGVTFRRLYGPGPKAWVPWVADRAEVVSC